jgi:hypothetical protein
LSHRHGLGEEFNQRIISIAGNFFDIVFCTEALEHIKNPDYCLSEIKRVLVDNRCLIVTMPNATGYWSFFYLGSLIPTKWLRTRAFAL